MTGALPGGDRLELADGGAILLPCLVALPTGLLRMEGRDLRHFIRGRNPAGHWDFRHGASPSLQVSFVIQRDGRLRGVQPVGARRRWAASFAWLHDLVILECEVAPGQTLANGQLLAHVQSVPAKPPFDLARKLRTFLKPRPESERFDEHLFRRFWEQAGPRLEPGAWAESFS